jgi:hypothetical protein
MHRAPLFAAIHFHSAADSAKRAHSVHLVKKIWGHANLTAARLCYREAEQFAVLVALPHVSEKQ